MPNARAKIELLLQARKPKTSIRFVYDRKEIDALADGVIWVLYNSPLRSVKSVSS